MILTGLAYCVKDNINTDEITPGRYLTIKEPEQLGCYAFADVDPDFQKKIKQNNILVAGENFGCGSSREQAAICLEYAGVKAIIAHSFARIFFRNAINIGLPVIELRGATNQIQQNNKLKIEMNSGIIKNISTQKNYRFHPLPEWMLEIIKAGGYIEWSIQSQSNSSFNKSKLP